MPVGTQATVKAQLTSMLEDTGSQILLANTYHLLLRPGPEIFKKMGGIHRFMSWKRSVLTDSGGFQIFSLPGLRKITDEGALFASALDGSVRMFSPETVVDIQCALQPDIAIVLDECPPYPCPPEHLSSAVERSIRWAERSYRRAKDVAPPEVNFFGIIQGGFNEQERLRSLEATAAIPFPGLALGGFCVGEASADTHRGLEFILPQMPADRPRYLMGMGMPQDILLAASLGADLFDCTIPTRNGRTGLAHTSRGKVRIPNARHAGDDQPLDPACACYTCRNFSRGFLRHLWLAREMNAAILMSLHNLAFYLGLMRGIREAIQADRLAQYRTEFLATWNAGDEDDEGKE
jgi:queuine tRNA-ribosyltransferase